MNKPEKKKEMNERNVDQNAFFGIFIFFIFIFFAFELKQQSTRACMGGKKVGSIEKMRGREKQT